MDFNNLSLQLYSHLALQTVCSFQDILFYMGRRTLCFNLYISSLVTPFDEFVNIKQMKWIESPIKTVFTNHHTMQLSGLTSGDWLCPQCQDFSRVCWVSGLLFVLFLWPILVCPFLSKSRKFFFLQNSLVLFALLLLFPFLTFFSCSLFSFLPIPSLIPSLSVCLHNSLFFFSPFSVVNLRKKLF